jgi:two-component system nitrate/nitrite response regulator NarL
MQPQLSNQEKVVHIVIADDHTLVRDGLKRMLQQQPDFSVVGEAADGDEALSRVHETCPDVLLLDLAMPNVSGITVLERLHAEQNPVRILLLTASIDRIQISTAIRLGARGVVMKTAALDVLIKSIHSIMAGQLWFDRNTLSDLLKDQSEGPESKLTPRELEIVGQLASGSANKDIAESLGISEGTVKRHLANIFEKVGVSNRLELAVLAMNRNLVPKRTT